MSPWGGKREGAGRPPKMGTPLKAGIKVNLTPEDRHTLDQAAEYKGIGPSELAREFILAGLKRWRSLKARAKAKGK